jgi:hypothetical protein
MKRCIDCTYAVEDQHAVYKCYHDHARYNEEFDYVHGSTAKYLTCSTMRHDVTKCTSDALYYKPTLWARITFK